MKRFGWAVLAAVLSASPLQTAWAASQCETSYQRLFFAGGNSANPVSFSYEIEINLKQNPKIVDFFKAPGLSDESWFALPTEKRLELAAEARTEALSKGREFVLERTSRAPEFLAPRVSIEANGNLELSENEITHDYGNISDHLDWFWEHIGPGSVQAHAVFKRSGVDLSGAASYIKHDFDIAQAESLQFGYEKFLEKGAEPGLNITHHSLSPLDENTLNSIDAKLKKTFLAGKTERLDTNTKLIYGISYRPDLYGRSRVGFEIRNCHNRLPCIKSKLLDLAKNLESGFPRHEAYQDTILISPAQGKDLPSEVRGLLLDARQEIRHQNRFATLGGAAPEDRFLFPLIHWERHPYIQAQPAAEVRKFQNVLEAAQTRYLEELARIGRSKANPQERVREMRIAMARWAHETKIADELNAGRKRLFPDRVEQPLADSIELPEVTSPIPEEEFHALSKEIFAKLGQNSQNKKFLRSDLFFAEVKRLDFLPQDVRSKIATDLPREKMEQLFGPKAILGTEVGLKNLRSYYEKMGAERTMALLSSSDSKAILERLFRQNERNGRDLLELIGNDGIRTSAETPKGGLIARNLRETKPNDLAAFMDFARAQGKPEAVRNLMTTQFVNGIPSSFMSPEGLNALTSVFGSEGPSGKDVDWLLRWYASKGSLKEPNDEALGIHQVILGRIADTLEPISDRETLAEIRGNPYLIKMDRKKHSLQVLPISGKELAGARKSAERFTKAVMAKEHVTVNDLQIMDAIKKEPNSVWVISATAIHHQGMVVGDHVYSVVSDRGVTRLPLSSWVNSWGSSTLIQIKVSPEQKQAIFADLESQIGKQVKFAINAEKGDVNCTTMISRALEKAGAFKFPTAHVAGDSQGQLQYLLRSSQSRPEIVRVFRRKSASNVDTVIALFKLYPKGVAAWLAGNALWDEYNDRVRFWNFPVDARSSRGALLLGSKLRSRVGREVLYSYCERQRSCTEYDSSSCQDLGSDSPGWFAYYRLLECTGWEFELENRKVTPTNQEALEWMVRQVLQ